MVKAKLHRELTLWDATFYGVGIILGAGIYALIGTGAGIAGNMLWLSFIIAALIASFTGLSYAELSSMYPREAAEFVYTKKAFGRNMLAFLVEWVMIFAAIISVATVAFGFAGYFTHLFGVMIFAAIISVATVAFGFAGYFTHLFGGDIMWTATMLVIALSVLNFIGIKESARFNTIATLIEAGGLVLVVIVGLFFIGNTNVDYFELPTGVGFHGILMATALIFFAYIGFEDVANIAEEVKNPARIVPKALVLALAISTVLYILVAIAAIGITGWEKLSASKAPLTDVVTHAIPQASLLMSVIALFATSNTVLIMLIVCSRMLYGMSSQHSLPKALSKIHPKHGTPYVSVAVVGLLSIGSLILGKNIKTVALLTDLGIFIAYFFVNLSLLVLRYRVKDSKRPFKVPGNIGKFSVLAFLGVVTCGLMLFYFEKELMMFEVVLIAVGAIVYKAFNR